MAARRELASWRKDCKPSTRPTFRRQTIGLLANSFQPSITASVRSIFDSHRYVSYYDLGVIDFMSRVYPSSHSIAARNRWFLYPAQLIPIPLASIS